MFERLPADPPEYDSARGKRSRWRSTTPRIFALLLLLLAVPLIRHLVGDSYESPFTSPDDGNPIASTFHFPIEPLSPFCNPEHTVLIMIVSRPSEFQLRKRIRSSWAHPDVIDSRRTRIWFLIGKGDERELAMIHEENALHNDIVMVEIEESYYSLSVKTLALLHYKQMRCPQVRCLVKADSDNVLNVRNYEVQCDSTAEDRIMGECSVTRRVIRSGSKWAVPFDVYPLPRYPQYCSTGTYFLVGKNTVYSLVNVVHKSNFFRSANMRKLPEDVLFTGIFAEMADIERESVIGLSFFGRPNYGCVKGSYRAFSLHMDKEKEPQKYFDVLNLYEGLNC